MLPARPVLLRLLRASPARWGLQAQQQRAASGGQTTPPSSAPPQLFVLTNAAYREGPSAHARGLKAVVSNLGAIVQSLLVPGRLGAYVDVVLGKDSATGYEANPAYLGAICGRFSNRIGHGRFELDGHRYQLSCNDHGKHHLHGGGRGWSSQVWTVDGKARNNNSITMTYCSRDGEEGYPGTVEAKVTMTLTDADALEIDMRATSDRPTIINMTHHGYFNLQGHDMGGLAQHCLRLNADHYTAVDADLIPTGAMGSALQDFDLGPDEIPTLGQVFASLAKHNLAGIDHNFVLRRPPHAKSSELHPAATLYDPVTGRIMRVSTNQPGLQIYTANCGFDVAGKAGAQYQTHAGICLETQAFPDAINQPQFPACTLRPGQHYHHKAVYRFTNDEAEKPVLRL